MSDLLAPSGNAARFDQPGDTITGTVISRDQRQQRDYATGQPKTWDNGDPMFEVVISLQTDNGTIQALYVRGRMLAAIRDAVGKAGAPTVEIGGRLAVRYTGDGEPAKPGFTPPKLFAAQYKRPELGADDMLATPAPSPATVVDDLL